MNSWYLWTAPVRNLTWVAARLRTPIAMPAPTRTLTLADVRRFVDEEVFSLPWGSRHAGRVGIELEWIVRPARRRRGAVAGRARRVAPRRAPGREPDHVRARRPARVERPGRTLARRPRANAMRADTATVRCALDHLDLDLVGAAIDTRGDVPRVLDAPRYRAMEEYFDSRWPAGRTMMRNTASIQVNLDAGRPGTTDHGDPGRIGARWHRAHDLGPVLDCVLRQLAVRSVRARPAGSARPDRRCGTTSIPPAPVRPAAPARRAADDWTRYLLDGAGDDDPRRRTRQSRARCAR